MPKVTCIITTTGRPTLNRAVQSVEAQTYKDLELIIVEDKARKGGSWALNQGIDASKGIYIAILDDDDEWVNPDKLKNQVKFLDEHPDYIAVGSGPQKGQGQEIKVNLIGTPFAHVSMMFRKGLKYDETLLRAKDLEFIIRLSKLGKLAVLPGCEVKFQDSTLEKKIDDCHWHRKVVLMHREFPTWFKTYIKLWQREMKLRRYILTNALRKIIGESAK